MEREDKIIMYDSPEAAYQKTVAGWVGDGHFYGDNEHWARWAGCTHVRCEVCETPIPKSYVKCSDCRAKSETAKFLSLEIVEWDRETPLAVFEDDTFFTDEDEIVEYAQEHSIEPKDIPLVLCEWASPRGFTLDAHDHFADLLPEDGDPSDELMAAVDAFNIAIKKAKPFSYSPTNKRVILSFDHPTENADEGI